MEKRVEDLDIGLVAERSGLPPSTLRYYEAQGLIQASGRHGLRRLFKPSVLERLALIRLGRRAGFSLEEIAATFADDGRPRIDRMQLRAKADEIDRQIEQLTTMRDGLRHAAACPARSHLECPRFRRLLRISTERRAGRQRSLPTRP
jgi:DNA-binding transcriptional MerR regulator